MHENKQRKAKLGAEDTAGRCAEQDVRAWSADRTRCAEHALRLNALVDDGLDYTQVKQAASLSQKILDTRLALSRMRQALLHPRLTEHAAIANIAGKDDQLQELADALASAQDEDRRLKDSVKKGSADAERLRMERTGDRESDKNRAGRYALAAVVRLVRSLSPTPGDD